ncbi:MAG: tetratricopeptide repeat protein [Bacteroidota bacterium]|nr:tetratricopeptide repeat protein [Bacteroidota bacterium]
MDFLSASFLASRWKNLKIILSGLYYILSVPLIAQSNHSLLDSLKYELSQPVADTNRVKLYLELGQQYEGKQVDSAIYYYKQAGKLSRKMNYLAGIIKYIAYYTEVLNHQGKFGEALQLNLEAVKLARQNNLKLPLAKSLVNTAVSYQYLADFQTSLKYYLQAMPIFEELKFENGLFILYSNLCGLYGQTLEEYDKALFYGNKALQLAQKQNNLYGIASAQLNKGIVFTRMKRYSEALAAIQEGYRIGKKLENLYLQETALANTGDIYLHQKQYARVIPIANETLKLAKILGDTEGQAIALGGLASAYFYTKNYSKAKQYAEQAVVLCRENQLRDELRNKIMQLSHIELAMGNLPAYNKLWAEGDSLDKAILNEKLRVNLQELDAKYQSAKKENQIKTLQKEKQIQV